MTKVLAQVFVYPQPKKNSTGPAQGPEHDILLPELRFDTLLGELVLLVSRFQFELPPYFINNARALATLEGLTQQIDATHNSMTAIYPFCLRRLFRLVVLGNQIVVVAARDWFAETTCGRPNTS